MCPTGQVSYLRVFPHPPHHSYHHGNGNAHCQQSANHDADYLAGAQAPWRTERQELVSFSDFHIFQLDQLVFDVTRAVSGHSGALGEKIL